MSRHMGRIFRILGLTAILSLSACAHVYQAPNNAKLEASTKRLSNAVTKAATTAERARSHVEAAQAAAKKEASAAETLSKQTDELVALLPPELKARGLALKAAVVEDHAEVGEIITNVYAAQQDHVELKKDVDEAKAADAQVKIDKAQYYQGADLLASVATKQSSSLAWYRRHWWGSWIALGAGVIACVIFAIVKWGTKWGAKAARAVAKVESGGIL